MKKYSLLVLFFLLPFFSYCQDTIVQADGTKVLAFILSIDEDFVLYNSPFENTKQVYSMSKDGVQKVSYENGRTLVFQPEQQNTPGALDMQRKGYLDAAKYYKGYKHASGGAFLAATFASPVGGLIPAIITSATTPKDKNLGAPSEILMDNEDYRKAYIETAVSKKRHKVWKAWGVGSVISMTAILATVTIVSIAQMEF